MLITETLMPWVLAASLTGSPFASTPDVVLPTVTSQERIAIAGDVNADGWADWVIGQPRDDTHGRSTGRVLVMSGADGRILHVFTGDSAGDRFGWSVAGAGDVDGDGHDDVIVGAPLDDPNGNASGSAFVFSGRDGTTLLALHAAKTGVHLGHTVAGAGDVDGDGAADLMVGDRLGTATVYSGRTGEALAAAPR